MKQHIFSQIGRLLILFSMFLTFFACKQDLQLNPETVGLSTEVQAAKVFFEKNNFPILSDFKGIQPLWEKTKIFGDVVEIPYTKDGKLPIPQISNELNENMGRKKLVLVKKLEGYYETYLLSYLPSSNFKGDVKNVNVRNLLAEKFDGIISYQRWNERELNNWYYAGGELTVKKIARIVSKDTPMKEDSECGWYEQCTNWYQKSTWPGGGTEYVLVGRTCIESYECVQIAGGNSNNNNNNGGGGCQQPPCSNNGSSSSGGVVGAVLTGAAVGKTLTKDHVLCPTSITSSNGVVKLTDFNLGLLSSNPTVSPYISPAGDWRIETNMPPNDPDANALGSIISRAFQMSMRSAYDYLDDSGIPISGNQQFSLQGNPYQFPNSNPGGMPLLNLNDFVQQQFGANFRTAAFDLTGRVFSGEVTTRSPLGSMSDASRVVASNDPLSECR
jgi:hypothetical protein